MAAGRVIVLMGVSGAGKTKVLNLDLQFLYSISRNAFSKIDCRNLVACSAIELIYGSCFISEKICAKLAFKNTFLFMQTVLSAHMFNALVVFFTRTIGKLLAVAMNCPFLDADDFHSDSNKEKMRNGIPLSDKDRSPWLMSLRDALSDYIANGKDIVCACSALQKQYREILRSSDPIYRQRVNKTSQAVKFVLLEVSEEVLAERVKRRREEEAHFMPAALLKSQLELLELDDSEGVVCIDGTQSGHTIVRAIQDQLCL